MSLNIIYGIEQSPRDGGLSYPCYTELILREKLKDFSVIVSTSLDSVNATAYSCLNECDAFDLFEGLAAVFRNNDAFIFHGRVYTCDEAKRKED